MRSCSTDGHPTRGAPSPRGRDPRCALNRSVALAGVHRGIAKRNPSAVPSSTRGGRELPIGAASNFERSRPGCQAMVEGQSYRLAPPPFEEYGFPLTDDFARVVAAWKPPEGPSSPSPWTAHRGAIWYRDDVKQNARRAVEALQAQGSRIMMTGDNERAAAAVAGG